MWRAFKEFLFKEEIGVTDSRDKDNLGNTYFLYSKKVFNITVKKVILAVEDYSIYNKHLKIYQLYDKQDAFLRGEIFYQEKTTGILYMENKSFVSFNLTKFNTGNLVDHFTLLKVFLFRCANPLGRFLDDCQEWFFRTIRY